MAFVRWRGNCAQLLATITVEGRPRHPPSIIGQSPWGLSDHTASVGPSRRRISHDCRELGGRGPRSGNGLAPDLRSPEG